MTAAFAYHDRWLSFISRWGLAPVIRRQYVAEHSYYVALYVSQLCNILGKDASFRLRALEYALRHDSAEVLVTDIPGPSKREFVDRNALKKFEDRTNARNGEFHAKCAGLGDADYTLKDICKAADLIDEVFYIHTEMMLGNRLIKACAINSHDRLELALARIGSDFQVRMILSYIAQELNAMTNDGVQWFSDNNSDLVPRAAE